MKIWLVQANEPMPKVDRNQRLFRTGLLAEELNKRGHDITWFATTFDHYTKTQRFSENTTVSINENYKLEFIWAPSYKKNISLRRIINHKYMALGFRKIIVDMDKPDLIYCSFPTIEFAEECMKYGKKHNVKVIVDIRDLWPDIFQRSVSFPLNKFIHPYVKLMDHKTKEILRKAYAIHGVSSPAVSWALKKIDRKKTDLDYPYFIGYQKKADIKKNMCKGSAKRKITFTGTIGKQMNYELIVNIGKSLMKLCAPVEIVICGDGPQLVEFKKMTENIENIKFMGWISADEIAEILSETSFGLIPYNNTFDFQMGAGNKFGEYLSYGLPLILTCEGVMETLIHEYNCGIMSMDADEIATYIVSLLKDDGKAEKASENALRLFEEQLNSATIYRNTGDYIERIMEGK
ncbi:glycosyltransferase family 4 protein [[Clostridium] innocuum]|nr:glycosyltransferase family 4 protein [[Clostridium] innocuum]MCR0575977.1 glycosyltransferase family 4 protein [[Clostridium] innocuum]